MTNTRLLVEIGTLIALVLGPAIGVYLTRRIDSKRVSRERKLDIFRTLMRTRNLSLNYEHVGALNLVEVEFARNTKVVNAWKSYLENLGKAIPPYEQKDLYDEFIRKREALLTKLVHEIARDVGICIEQLDILQGNYVPQGWIDDESEQRLVRQGLIDVLYGRRSLPIYPYQPPTGTGPYPSPPKNT